MVTIPNDLPDRVQDVGLIIPTNGTLLHIDDIVTYLQTDYPGTTAQDVIHAVARLRDRGLDTPLVSSRDGYTFTTDMDILSEFVAWWFGRSRTTIRRGGLVLRPVYNRTRSGRRFLRDIGRIAEDIEDLISV